MAEYKKIPALEKESEKMKGFIEVTAIFKHKAEQRLINISHIKEVIKCDDNGGAFIVLSSVAKKGNDRMLRIGFYVSECYDWILDKIREAVEG